MCFTSVKIALAFDKRLSTKKKIDNRKHKKVVKIEVLSSASIILQYWLNNGQTKCFLFYNLKLLRDQSLCRKLPNFFNRLYVTSCTGRIDQRYKWWSPLRNCVYVYPVCIYFALFATKLGSCCWAQTAKLTSWHSIWLCNCGCCCHQLAWRHLDGPQVCST